jgi:hypothetical protein
VMVMFAAYNLFVYSEFVASPHARYYTGYVLIGLTSFTISVNMLVVVMNVLFDLARTNKRKFYRNKRRLSSILGKIKRLIRKEKRKK